MGDSQDNGWLQGICCNHSPFLYTHIHTQKMNLQEEGKGRVGVVRIIIMHCVCVGKCQRTNLVIKKFLRPINSFHKVTVPVRSRVPVCLPPKFPIALDSQLLDFAYIMGEVSTLCKGNMVFHSPWFWERAGKLGHDSRMQYENVFHPDALPLG